MNSNEMDYWYSLLEDLKRSTDDIEALRAKMLDIGCPDRVVESLLYTSAELK